MGDERGFSVVELVVAAALTLALATSVFALLQPSHGAFAAEPEAADMQQRLRVAADALDEALYGAGAATPADVAAIAPYRRGAVGPAPPGSFAVDVLSVASTPRTGATPLTTTYSLKSDDRTGTYQLMMYDGTSNPDVPVVDNIVALRFDYYGDPRAPAMIKALDDPIGPWTTYGPPPSAAASPPFGPGENCVFWNDGSSVPQPRLAALGDGGTTLVELTPEQLADGPWCPNDSAADRWDADLLRVRRVAVTIRAQAAAPALRGPAGVLFTHGGSARLASRWVPDREVRLDVSPRNLNLRR